MRTCLLRMRAASSRVPASWDAPPVRTARRPGDVEAACAQMFLHLPENFLETRLDNAREHRARHAQCVPVAVLAHRGTDARVGPRLEVAERRAEESLRPFGRR